MPSYPKNTRKCMICREHADKSEMLRFVKKDGVVTLDFEGGASGRGAYVHKNAECVGKLKKRKALNAAFRCSVPDSVYDEI